MKKKQLSSSRGKIDIFLFLAIITFSFLAFSDAYRQTPTVSVSADKMNILYIGIDNPITVAVEGVLSEDLTVTCEDGEVENLGNGHYNVQVRKPGKKKITVIAKGVTTQEIIYRVKRIPDPTANVGFIQGGSISAERIKLESGVQAYLSNWPLEETCEIRGYYFTWTREGENPIEVVNAGEKFNDAVLKLLEQIQSGDVIYFDQIRAKCPGDPAARKINSMVFKIR